MAQVSVNEAYRAYVERLKEGRTGEVTIDVGKGIAEYRLNGEWGIIRFAEFTVYEDDKLLILTDLAGQEHTFHYVTHEARDGKLYFKKEG